MRKRWLLLPAAALIAVSAALVNASVSGAGSADVPTTTNVKVWIGLKNSDDVGTRFDLKADVTNDSGTVSGVLSNFSGGSSGFNNAHLATIPVVTTGQVSSVKIWARVSCQSGHTSGTARLWWNDTAAASRVEPDGSGVRYLTGTSTLGPSVGLGPKMTSDVLVKKTGCPAEQPVGNWKLFGTWTAAPSCTAGSEDFSGAAQGSQPSTFAGGTIDTSWTTFGAIHRQGNDWFGTFADGTHLVSNGLSPGPFRLTFTNSVGSVQLNAESGVDSEPRTQTLTAYDSSNAVVDTDSLTVTGALSPLSVTSATNNIKHFTIATTDRGFAFSNVVWTCN